MITINQDLRPYIDTRCGLGESGFFLEIQIAFQDPSRDFSKTISKGKDSFGPGAIFSACDFWAGRDKRVSAYLSVELYSIMTLLRAKCELSRARNKTSYTHEHIRVLDPAHSDEYLDERWTFVKAPEDSK